ncbi:MAG: Gfo/Idh/MocA family protein [Bacillota bacterium]
MSTSNTSNSKGISSAVSRRGFVAGSVATAASVAFLSRSAHAADAPRKIKLGVVGCGGRGGWIARLFQQNGGYEMYAVADYFQGVADACGDALGVDKGRRFSGLSGYKKVIDSGVEAIALEVPPYFFPEQAQAAVDAGLHVYMAKPVAADVPGCMQIEAAAKKATENKKCFFIDYQMPTDPYNIEAVKRLREGALGRLGMVRSHYYGGLFGDPPRTANLESRLRNLIWVNDVAIGGGYHVNACIHPVQGMMWALGKTPVAASGASRVARANPHGDSHDMFAITFEFADGLVWSHSGRHATGLTGPEDPLAECEFLGDAYMRIGYGGRAMIRGGTMQYAGGTIDNLYEAGAVRNIATFYKNVTQGLFTNDTVRLAVDSCLVTILGREAAARKTRLTMDELIKENKRLEVDLSGLKA